MTEREEESDGNDDAAGADDVADDYHVGHDAVHAAPVYGHATALVGDETRVVAAVAGARRLGDDACHYCCCYCY